MVWIHWNFDINLCYKKYELERASTTIHDIPTLVWITNMVWEHRLAGGTFDDHDVVALSIPPSTKTCNYKRIKAYGSDFRVDDETSVGCVSYDNKVASFFSHSNVDDNHHPSRQLQYVGVLKDILQLGTEQFPSPLFCSDVIRFKMLRIIVVIQHTNETMRDF